jgi:GNAT superfamily N-acetyltransferase
MDEQTIDTTSGPITIRRGSVEDVVELRHAVLRAGLPRETAVFEGDAAPGARHVVAVSAAAADGRVVGCATVHPSTWDDSPAWQLRGMATDPTVRSTGIGRAMLLYLERLLMTESDVRQLWCNARTPARGFYERLGWHVVSDVFEIPTAGPHVRMTKRLERQET